MAAFLAAPIAGPEVIGSVPPIAPIRGERRVENFADGSQVDQLLCADGNVYQFVRTINQALMGKIRSAIELMPAEDGLSYIIPPKPTMVAIKQLVKDLVHRGVSREGKPVMENPLHEVAVTAYLSEPGHPNVMRLLNFVEDDANYYIVYEFLEKDLFDQLELSGMRLDEATARSQLYQCIKGVHYMHCQGITHRDLSLENAMTSLPGTVKIIDFGVALKMPPEGYLLPADGRVGKDKYMAPETYALLPYDGRKIDVWCIGVMLFVMVFGTYPYQKASSRHCRYFKEITEGNLIKMLESWGLARLVSPELLDVLNRTMTVNPLARISLEELLAHPWFAPERAADAVMAASGPADVAMQLDGP